MHVSASFHRFAATQVKLAKGSAARAGPQQQQQRGPPADTGATEIGLQMSPCGVSALCVCLSPSIPSPSARFSNKEISISLDPADNDPSYLNVGDSCHMSHPEREELRLLDPFKGTGCPADV